VQGWLPPSTTVAAEIGTALYGALNLQLPPECDLLDQPVWSSIGFTLPAVLGAALARPDRRPVLFIGDGSAQLTVQELGTFYARGIRPVVFVLNNDGYTVERILQSPKADYHDIVQWNWTELPSALGGTNVRTAKVCTVRELRDAPGCLGPRTCVAHRSSAAADGRTASACGTCAGDESSQRGSLEALIGWAGCLYGFASSAGSSCGA
jgi:TPP-dependent 2-oxoacid decarboxylase